MNWYTYGIMFFVLFYLVFGRRGLTKPWGWAYATILTVGWPFSLLAVLYYVASRLGGWDDLDDV